MNRHPSETGEADEAPAASYPPATRVAIALEQRLHSCPACAAPVFRLESVAFANAEGAGHVVKVRFLCDAGAAAMVTPSASVRAYAFDPCREVMRRGIERIAAEAAIFGEEAA